VKLAKPGADNVQLLAFGSPGIGPNLAAGVKPWLILEKKGVVELATGSM
jgi:hypothetical protein